MCPKLEPLHICTLHRCIRRACFGKSKSLFTSLNWKGRHTEPQLRHNQGSSAWMWNRLISNGCRNRILQKPVQTKKKKKTQPQMQPFPFSLSLCSSSPGLLLHCASPQTYLLSRWPVFHCLLLHFVIVSSRTAPRPRFYSGAEDGQDHIDSRRSRAVPWTRTPDTCKRATHEQQVILRPTTHHLVPTNLI